MRSPAKFLAVELSLDGGERLDRREWLVRSLVRDPTPSEAPDVEGLAQQLLQVGLAEWAFPTFRRPVGAENLIRGLHAASSYS